jgi:hypothetical protein
MRFFDLILPSSIGEEVLNLSVEKLDFSYLGFLDRGVP